MKTTFTIEQVQVTEGPIGHRYCIPSALLTAQLQGGPAVELIISRGPRWFPDAPDTPQEPEHTARLYLSVEERRALIAFLSSLPEE